MWGQIIFWSGLVILAILIRCLFGPDKTDVDYVESTIDNKDR